MLTHAALPAVMAEREATDGKPLISRSVSPCLCMHLPRAMPSFCDQPREHGGMALAGRLHVQADDSCRRRER